ncbi:cubilin-like [Physella acuta]|uniref:cubilin-like n=1 Tax=Physella acuta TaxID=109671 RepID=UPI0027DD5864|nr:cubilin-like [Physella acuta]
MLAGRGFKLVYSYEDTSSSATVDNRGGEIQSPNFPNSYPIGRTSWDIPSIPNKLTTISFLDFEVQDDFEQCNYDTLKIYEGNSENDTLLRTLCTQKIPSSISSTNNLHVVFNAVQTSGARGFRFIYTYANIAPSDSHIIQSPNYPLNYPYQSASSWTIPFVQRKVTTITFLDFHIEKPRSSQCDDNNYVKIYNGTSARGHLLLFECGYRIPSPVTSPVNLYIEFRAKGLHGARGFKLAFSYV